MIFVIALTFSLCGLGYDVGDFSYNYDLESRTGTLIGYRGSSHNVIVPSTFIAVEKYEDENGETHTRHYTITVTAIGYLAFQGSNITSVSLPETIQAIYDSAFADSAIETLSTPKSLTYIGQGAFGFCRSLKKIDIDGDNLVIMKEAFDHCTSLETVVLGEGVESLEDGWHYFQDYGMFTGCTSLKSIEIRSSRLKRLPSYFCSWTPVEQVSFPAVTEIGYQAFIGCTQLKEVGTFAHVVKIEGDAFNGCSSLEGPLNCPLLTNMGAFAFSGCSSLRGLLSLPSIETISQCAFAGCSSLSELHIPSVKTIGNSAFSECSGLIGALNLGSERIEASAFWGCTGLVSVKTSTALSFLGNSAFYGCRGLNNIEIDGDGTLNVDYSVFRDCTSLESAIFGEGVASFTDGCYQSSIGLGPGTYYGTFLGCTSLKSVEVRSRRVHKISDYMFYNTPIERVSFVAATTVGQCAFEGCDKLIEVPFISDVRDIGYRAFAGCTSLTGPLDFSSLENVGSSAFSSCTALTGSTSFPSVTCVQDSSFSGCTSLDGQLSMPQALEVGNSAFSGCKSLTGISAPSLATIRENAFSGCIGLTGELWLPALKTTDSFAFCRCSGLKSVRMPKTLSILGWGTFQDCTGLTDVIIDGDGELHVGGYIFSGCTSLEYVIFEEGVASIDDGSIGGTFGGYKYYMFLNCNKLQTVQVKSTKVTKVPDYMFRGTPVESVLFANATIIGQYAFDGCNMLTEAPSLVNVIDIGYGAFSGCSSLRLGSIELPSVQTICGNAFSGCMGIDGASFGNSLVSIGDLSFSDCRNASIFDFMGTPPSATAWSFQNVKSGAIGTYTAEHAADWEAVIDSSGYWHGLKMTMAPKNYTVSYYGNGGSGSILPQSFESGKPQNLTKNAYIKYGCVFQGWATSEERATAGTIDYNDEQEITVDHDMTLYAVWADLRVSVNNVRGQQRQNSKLVDIYYELNAIGGRTCTVDIEIEGMMTDVTAATFSGDIGNDVLPGKNRHVIWHADEDWHGRKGNVKVVAGTLHGATGSSAWFFVDTTDGELKVADVTSKYFDGEYSGVGRKATFLSGVSCDIEMTILMDDYSMVDHWLVNGREVTTRTFTFDVGSLPVGGRLEVVAVGKNDGVRSKPFRVNFDVAAVPSEISWMNFNVQGHLDEVVYRTSLSAFEFELASSRDASISALDWLPQKTVKVSPKISFKTEIGSSGNGSLRLLQTDLNVDKSKTFLGTQTRRPNGMFAQALGVALGFSFTGGPLTATWDAKELRWKFQSVTFGMGISGKCETPPWCIPSPIGDFYLAGRAEADISALCDVRGFSSQGGLDAALRLSSDRLPAFTLIPGYGVYKWLNVEVPLSLEFPFDAVCEDGDWTTLRYGWKAVGRITATIPNPLALLQKKAFAFKVTLYEWPGDTHWFINEGSSKSMRLMSGASSSDIEWKLQSRDYLKKGTPRMRLMATAPTDGVVESGGYPDPAPSMASGTAGDALAYLRDNAERTSANRTELVLRTGTSNEWDVAEIVWDDGTADFMPEIAAMPNGSFVATWANTGRTFSDDVTLPEMCTAMEIAVGVRNAATGAWSCRNLTADSVLDFAPVVRAGTNGTALVAWLRNAAGSLVGSAAEPTDIMASVYVNGTWSAPAAVVSGAGSVSGFDVAFDGENAVLAFSKDADGNQETMGDMEIFAVSFNGAAWGEPARLTYAGDSDGQPFVRGGAGTGFAVLWTEKGTLMETTELAVSNAVAVAAADGWMLSGGCSVMRGADGRDALVWGGDSAAGGVANAPVAMMYDPVCGAWGAPRKLLDDGRYERQLAGAVGADGGIRIGYESSSVSTNAQGEVIFGDVELRTRYIPAICDLAVAEGGFSFASDDLADGDETVLTVKVVNLGFKTATNATVTVYEGVGDEKGELESVVTNFPGGGVVAVNVPWTVDNTQSNLQFTVEIDAGVSEDEGADGNNVYIWNAGAYDVSFAGVAVRNESATRRLLTAAVSNAGLGPLPNGGKVVFRRGGENGDVLGVDEIGTVWPGTNGVYNAGFAWDMEGVTFTSAWETVCVQLFPEGVVGSALDAADMMFVQVMTTRSDAIFPPLSEGATEADVESALSVGTDAGLTNITDVAVYEAFRQWVDAVKGVDGLTTAGAQAVKDSTRAWLSFALGVDRLIGKDITSNDVHIVSFRAEAAGGGQGTDRPASFAFEVAIDGVDVGSGSVAEETLKENLKKVVGVEGAAMLDESAFSSDNIEITFEAPIDGKARFTATPPADAGNTFFLRVKVR